MSPARRLVVVFKPSIRIASCRPRVVRSGEESEKETMDRLGKDVVRSLAIRSRGQPENEMLGPFRAYRRIILCRDLRLNYHRRILRFGRRAREISRPGG